MGFRLFEELRAIDHLNQSRNFRIRGRPHRAAQQPSRPQKCTNPSQAMAQKTGPTQPTKMSGFLPFLPVCGKNVGNSTSWTTKKGRQNTLCGHIHPLDQGRCAAHSPRSMGVTPAVFESAPTRPIARCICAPAVRFARWRIPAVDVDVLADMSMDDAATAD